MAGLTRVDQLARERSYDLGTGYHDPTGATAYAAGGEKVGTVKGAMAEDGGRLRYLIVDVGGWFASKQVLMPVGMARIEDDAVYFDSLTRDQVKNLNVYEVGREYGREQQTTDERVLRGTGYAGTVGMTGQGAEQRYNYRDDENDTMFRAPQRLQLLEERLLVNKQRYVAGQVEIGKRVETRQETVTVPLQREEVVIERHAVTDPRPVEGNVTLGAASEALRVDLEAERARVGKQAFVTEEVEIGKRTVTDTQQVTEMVGREVLNVEKTGDVKLNMGDRVAGQAGDRSVTMDGKGALDRAGDAVKDAADPGGGKTDRR
ncbi:PRC and DUF2382 domain-containing protein [Deinococcus aestuarii]|uniref:PRC and DUF2382 domain-containing protein n=1 Tax=Deinococcus aestuarii TaxID=2774531 RepID=UPI001C0C0D46|nr:DUF2382 domain-containing protein [Deinococcus aestuarii]